MNGKRRRRDFAKQPGLLAFTVERVREPLLIEFFRAYIDCHTIEALG